MWEGQGLATILGGDPETRGYRLASVPDVQPGPSRGSQGNSFSGHPECL